MKIAAIHRIKHSERREREREKKRRRNIRRKKCTTVMCALWSVVHSHCALSLSFNHTILLLFIVYVNSIRFIYTFFHFFILKKNNCILFRLCYDKIKSKMNFIQRKKRKTERKNERRNECLFIIISFMRMRKNTLK